ncbi:DUF5667 domain-containing protein [Geodermatophilus sp. DSM 45219]|uniref:DUF5667 domain-containing protein n=1 Tax=Geodermatophilus sp. DSM 45219 TaxID=1881103 RepID=UPI00087EB30E|nr:DUF5667 domain-containing protein [Geodermatophilus sp. DSM 45219]SDO38828.1 hypothetical protein SAMN05428965_3859 [Geodermatophilus sp. DSM 45219]
MSTHAGTTPPGDRRAAVRDQEDAVLARLRQLSADLDDAPDPAFRSATRDRLVAMAAVRAPRPEPRPGLRRLLPARADDAPSAVWRTRLTAGLAGAALAVTTLGTLVALSTDARPGDALYGVKRGTEQTQLALAGDDRGLTLLEFAATRLDELAALTDPAAPDVVGLLDTMDAQTREGAALLATRAADGVDPAPVVELAGWAEQQTTELTALQPGLPTGAATATQESLGLLADVSARATGLRAALACADGRATVGTDPLGPVPAECPAADPGSGAPAGGTPSGGAGSAPSGGAPAPGDPAAPGGTPADPPGPAPAPSAPSSGTGGDRDTGSPSDGGGTAPVVPEVPADDQPVGTVPTPQLPAPVPVVPEEPEAPLLDTPLPVCIRPLVC